MTCCCGRERLGPRTLGITQKEQRLSHPSCTFRLGRVRSDVLAMSDSKTGAAKSSVWAKISETKMRSVFNAQRSVRAVAGIRVSWRRITLAAEALSNGLIAGLEAFRHSKASSNAASSSGTWADPWAKFFREISASRCLWELPTTA